MQTSYNFLSSLDRYAVLHDLPNEEFEPEGSVSNACKAAGYTEPARGVIDALHAWRWTVSKLIGHLDEFERDVTDRSHIWTPPAFTLPTAPLGDPSDRMRLANAIAASLEADPALVDDLRNALSDRVATRLHRDWRVEDDERSAATIARNQH